MLIIVSAYNNTIVRRATASILCGLLLWFGGLGSSASTRTGVFGQSTEDSGVNAGANLLRSSLVAAAHKLLGRTALVFGSNFFSWDCSGTVLAAGFTAGLDLRTKFAAADGNGVRRLYQLAQEQGALYDLPLPEIGDMVFWDNTYDYNNDGLWNDDLTHVGLVVAVDSDGTITYVHHDYSRGIVTATMNLWQPDATTLTQADGSLKTINSPMRMRSQRYINPNRWLASHLFRGFARTVLLQP